MKVRARSSRRVSNGFRPWPLQNCVIVTLLRLNNKDFNTREQLWLFPILQYTPADKLNKLYSFMPHRKCQDTGV